MKKKGMSLEEALKFVKERRKVASPNEGFRKQLAEYEKLIQESKNLEESKD